MQARFYRAMQPDADGRPVVGAGPSMDPRKPAHHGFVEPSQPMRLDGYQAALASTKPAWEEYVP